MLKSDWYYPFRAEMVARNFNMQELSYSQLLSVPDDDSDFLDLEELKTNQQTQLEQQYHQNDYYEYNT